MCYIGGLSYSIYDNIKDLIEVLVAYSANFTNLTLNKHKIQMIKLKLKFIRCLYK